MQLVPGKKSLAVVCVFCIAYALYEYPIIESENGPGVVFGLLLFFSALLGVALGAVNKAVTLFTKSKGYNSKKRLALRCLAISLFLLVLYIPSIYRSWDRRPPPSSCNTERIEFSIAGEKFISPGAAVISANRGDGVHKPHDSGDGVYFFGPRNKRDFCWEFNNGLQPANVNLLTINLRKIGGHKVSDNSFSDVCKKAEWPGELCDKQTLDLPPTYPDEIQIYDKQKFKPGYFSGGWDYKKIKEKISDIKRPSDIDGFSFDGHDYYWIEDKENESFSLRCYKTTPKLLYCRSEEVWSGDVHVNYGGRVSLESPVSEARAIRAKTWEFLNSISIKQ